uniref:Uncharacterized protein n=1 Tax=viral metagenome TaxID=1070528 RepID=A0A6M3J0L9_9ZZZZ
MPEQMDYTYSLHKRGPHLVIFHLYRYTTGSYPRYSQYINNDGKWYIVKESELGNVKTIEYYLPTVFTTIDTDWVARADKTYGRFDEIFPAE